MRQLKNKPDAYPYHILKEEKKLKENAKKIEKSNCNNC